MTDTAVASALDYYARIGAALFPIPAGSKSPVGIIESFAHDYSKDPAQWASWHAQHRCNFGLVAGPSRLIIVDVDVAEIGRDRAWAFWSDWCTSRNLPVYAPHVQSARGGWHIAFALPADFDPAVTVLRQVPLIGVVKDVSTKPIIDLRVNNGFVVAAGSYYDGTAKQESSGPYLLISDAAPYPMPVELLAACSRARRATPSAAPGNTDPESVRELVKWLVDNSAIETYDDWVHLGMICKIEAGDAGLDIWALACHNQVIDDNCLHKWDSFADASKGVGERDLQQIGSLLHKAKKLGWTGNLRASAQWMFRDIVQPDIFGNKINVNAAPSLTHLVAPTLPPVPSQASQETVAAIAAAANATLSSQAMPLLDTQRIVAALGQPILDNFSTGTQHDAVRPMTNNHPRLPDTSATHPLYDLMNEAIERIVAMAETPKSFRQTRVLKVLSVLYAMHPTVCEHLTQLIAALGGVISPGALDSAVKNFEGQVRVEHNTAAGFILTSKGEPAPDNSDNVHVFLRQRAVKFRVNTWKDQIEVSDADKDAYSQLTDRTLNSLLVDAENSQFNYHPSENRFRRGVEHAACRTPYDPLVERVNALADKWDGVARLDTWMTDTCGVLPDEYHAAVGRNLIGGMVRRARHAGCEHAETVIFISPTQGTGKSTLCKVLALDPTWHTDSLKFGGSQQNTIPQMAGKWVIELSELAGMNKSDVEDIKNFMSATTDNYTKKYQAFATDQPRRCVFIGTSNDRRPLADATGGRRFLPVHVQGEVNLEWLRANVEQIIGECAAREAAGELFAIPRAVWEAAGQHQEAARNMTPVEELCYEWFDRPTSSLGGFYITATDIGRALKMAGQSPHARYASFLDKMGWRNENITIPGTGRKGRVWARYDSNYLDQCVRLVPTQTQVNGPVEMRFAAGPVSTPSGPLPPPY